ncbi:hypothetical protein [Kitasatospora sp. NPDC059571]|uniref:hypothetical protein n=1 Tax=Kitasatospora sp. NPDC059571 TaxID=3346871 RepID=UPI00367FAFF9
MFAAALMGREVLGTLSVHRQVLLIAELAVDDASGLAGLDLHDVEAPGGVRVIAVRLGRRPADLRWDPADRARRPAPGDRIVVAATRGGPARLNAPVPTAAAPVPPARPAGDGGAQADGTAGGAAVSP